MSLFDVDKSSSNREAPAPNRHDTKNHRMSKATSSVNFISDTSDQTAAQINKSGVFTIVKVGTFTLSSTPATSNPGAGNYASDHFTLYTDPHNLGFVPTVLGYLFENNTYLALPWINHNSDSGTGNALWRTYTLHVDNTNVYFDRITTAYNNLWTFSGPVTVKYYLLQQRAN